MSAFPGALQQCSACDDPVGQAIAKSVRQFFEIQRTDGSWRDQLCPSAISTGVALIALHFADRPGLATLLEGGSCWLQQTQRLDGSWGDGLSDPGNLNGTAIAISALHLIDPDRSQAALERGLAFIQAQGGFEALADTTRCSLSFLCLTCMALAGLYAWDRLTRIPLELLLLPKGLRQKLSFALPVVISWGLMHACTSPGRGLRRVFNRIAEHRALRWLEEAQASDGGIGESPFLAALVFIGLTRAGVGRHIADLCLSYVLAARRQDGSWAITRDFEFSATALSLLGLEASGYLHDARLQLTLSWILRSQWTKPFAPTGCPEGGWGWSLPSGWPNPDDTGYALLVLSRMGVPSHDPHIRRGCRWLLSMQNRDGSWSSFVKGGRASLDQACPDFTAHALLGLHESMGWGSCHPVIKRALHYYQRVQRADGAIHALWFRNYVAGTAFVLEVYAALGLSNSTVAVKCRNWLMANQNDDGSWGSQRGVAGTVEETAWALSSLLAGGIPESEDAVGKAVEWLVERQQADGSWPPAMVGVYFHSLYWSSDHIANANALQALGLYWQRKQVKCR